MYSLNNLSLIFSFSDKKKSLRLSDGPVNKTLVANAGGTSLILVQRTKIPHVLWHCQKMKIIIIKKKPSLQTFISKMKNLKNI